MKRHALCLSLVIGCAASPAAAGNPFASEVIDYEPGSPEPGLVDPSVVLGSPTRFTGAGIFPSVVSVFNPPWADTEIVSIGPGGHLVVRFDTPILDHPDNPFGIDLLIFGNTGFVDVSFPQGVVGGLLGNDGGMVEVSADGKQWVIARDVKADGLFPTQGYLDSGPFDETPGRIETDFTQPVDPSFTLDDFLGLDFEQVMELYGGSGGGAGVDIAATGLAEVFYVRISNPSGSGVTVELDAFARVTPQTPDVLGDLNGDGVVDVSDLLLLLAAWGQAGPGASPEDLNGDGVVDVSDLLILLSNWG